MRTFLTAALVALVAATLVGLLPAVAGNTTGHWGDLVTPSFGLALLAAWAVGSLIFTNRRRRT